MTEDIKLAQFAQDGDLNAFNRLIVKYQDMAYNVAYRMLSDPASAEDAVQDSFISAYKKIKSYRGGSFKAWLMRIVTNNCYDELRRQKRRPTTALEPVNIQEDEEIESPHWMIDPGISPEEQTELNELDRAVQHCLQDLPDKYRSVVVLIDVQGMDYKEASTITDMPLGTIKSRLSRARGFLQNCLQQFWELLPEKFRLMSEEAA